MHYIQPNDRSQYVFMNKLDDMIGEDNIVRLLDYLIDTIIKEHPEEFSDKGLSKLGRKAYHPSVFLKLYIYGYLNGINSSRKLERESQRNIELIWLIGALKPDFKTIADYRKDNGDKITKILERFECFLKDKKYITGKTISIDGSKIRANASISVGLDSIEEKIKNWAEQLRSYFELMDQHDTDDDFKDSGEKEKLMDKIKTLEKEIEKLHLERVLLKVNNIRRYSPTDKDCRMMKGREGSHFSYNVQSAVDEKNKMIIITKVTSKENDKDQLEPIVKEVKTTGFNPDNVLADTGYYKMEAIKNVENSGTQCFIPINKNQNTLSDEKSAIYFIYNPKQDEYVCSEGQRLVMKVKRKLDVARNTIMSCYESTNCTACSKKQECCGDKMKRNKWRHEDQDWRDAYETKINSSYGKLMISKRKGMVEHPFGTLKTWMGKIPLKLRGLAKVQTEINLYHMAYNFKRLLSVQKHHILISQIEKYKWTPA